MSMEKSMKTALLVGTVVSSFLGPALNVSAQVITTIAGGGTPTPGFCGDGGPVTDACLDRPTSVKVDPDGHVLIAEGYSGNNNRIRLVDADGNITTVAGSGTAGFCGDGGPATDACLNQPTDLAVDPTTGNLLIADWQNNRIRSVDADGNITTVAGSGTAGFCGDGGPATSACLNQPYSVTVDASGNLFIADWANHRVRRVDAATRIITTVAGSVPGFCGDGGPAMSACLNFPNQIAINATGDLFIADYSNGRIRKVDAAGIITTVAGRARGFCGDGGPATSACLNPAGVAVDDSGNLFIGDWDNHRVRRVDATTAIISTVAGNGTPGFCGDNGPATSACLYFPAGVTVSPDGLLIADWNNHRIRLVQ